MGPARMCQPEIYCDYYEIISYKFLIPIEIYTPIIFPTSFQFLTSD